MNIFKSSCLVAVMVLTIVGGSSLAYAKDCHDMGGTAVAQALNENEFAIATEGNLNGGGYAKVHTAPEKVDENHSKMTLSHYFVTSAGSYIYTNDVLILTQLSKDLYFGETTYEVGKSGGEFEGMRGAFTSTGLFDFAAGTVVVKFKGKICR